MYSLLRLMARTGKSGAVFKTIAAAACAIVLSAPASAGSSYGGVITNIITNTDLGIIEIHTNGTDNGRPACTQAGEWAIALNSANNQVYAQLLTAYATQATVYMWGDGVCSVSSSIETLVQLQVGGPSP